MEQKSEALLCEGLERLRIPYVQKEILQLETFISELLLFNSRFNLVNAETADDIIVRHILDSLAGFHLFASLAARGQTERTVPLRIADIGSGAGFPGIPLALFFPNAHVTLVERMERRASFLENVIAILKLQNVRVSCKKYESVCETFDAVTLRALTALKPQVLASLLNIIAEDGELILYKGTLLKTKAEVTEATSGIKTKINWEIIPVAVPFLQSERCMVRVFKDKKI